MGASQFELFGEVRLKTAPAAAGVKEISSQIQGLAQSGIAGFEAVQQKVIAATKEVAALRNALLQTQDPAQQKQLNAQLSEASTRLRAAKVEMRGMSLESREANEKVQMLAASLGVRVPQGLAQILARMPGIQRAMEAAFNITIIGAFVAGLVGLGVAGYREIEKLRGKTEELAGWLKKAADENMRLFLGFTTSKEGTERLAELTKRSAEVAHKIEALKKQLEDLDPAAAAAAIIIASRLNKAEAEGRDITTQLNEGLANQTKILKTEHKEAMEEATKAAERHRKELLDLADVMYTNWQGLLDLQKQAVEAEKAADETITRSRHEMAIQTGKDAEEAIHTMEQHGQVMDQRIIRQSKEAQDATREAARAQEQMLEATAGKIESFIDRVFLTARSLSDVFHQFLMQLLGSFVKWISQMLASWLTGIRQATAGAANGGIAGGGGGLLGSLLGGLFGLGTGTPAAAATGGAGAAWGGAQSLTLPGGGYIQGITGPLEAGAVGTLGGGIPQAVGGATQGTLGALAFHPGQFLAGLPTMLAGMGILGGIGLAGSGGPVRGALGGALAGGGIGLGLYSLGLLGGPLGLVAAGIGAAIGALVGLFRRGGQKKKASGLEQGFEFAANDLFEQFKQFKIDYESALSGMQALILQGQQSLTSAGLGRWGRQGAENLTRVIQDEIRALEALEKQREARATLMAGMTIPEFAVGGSVSGFGTRGLGLGGGILAILHPGEFVMRQQAVDALGTNFLAALNRAPRFDSGGNVGTRDSGLATRSIHIGSINVYPERGMTDREAAQMVVRGLRRAERDGAL
jgi:hypothetical protein